MGKFLDKMIKNSSDVQDVRVRAAYGTSAGIVGIGTNLVLFAVKLVIGILLSSMAVTADAVNNLSDAVSSGISLVSARISEKPADQEHPFGHGRIEYIAAFIIVFAIVEVGISFFRESFQNILHPKNLGFSAVLMVLLVIAVLAKLWLYFFYNAIGKKISSTVLHATAMDSLFDCLTTSITIFSVAAERLLGIHVDGFAGIFVSLLIVWAGIGIVRDVLSPLLGQSEDPKLRDKIEELVSGQEKAEGTHDLIIHNYGPGKNFATIHMLLPKEMTVAEAHAIADAAESAVWKELGVMLVVHVDPSDVCDAETQKLRSQMERLIKLLDPDLEIHDFSSTVSDGKTHLQFELHVPYSYKKEQEERVVSQCQGLLKELDPKCTCEIQIERGYMNETLGQS